jgi:hypothetical protein
MSGASTGDRPRHGAKAAAVGTLKSPTMLTGMTQPQDVVICGTG